MTRRRINSESLIKIAMVVMFLFYAWSAGAGVDASGTANDGQFQLVKVASGDTVWTIATRSVGEKEDVRNLVVAIRKANNLNNNAEIQPGQVLKVPVKSR